MRLTIATLALLVSVGAAAAQDRFAILQPDAMNAEQKKLLETIVSGPRAANYGGDAVNRVLKGGPFNAWMRSPELGMRLQAVGEQIRFKSSIPKHLNEFAILITAREWTSQYEWYAHHSLAMKAGLNPQVAADLAARQAPLEHERRRGCGVRLLHPASPSQEGRRRDLRARESAVRRTGRGRSDRGERLLQRGVDDAQRGAGAGAGWEHAAEAAGLEPEDLILRCPAIARRRRA
jgi:alkylhydroperoxidase family enzyme